MNLVFSFFFLRMLYLMLDWKLEKFGTILSNNGAYCICVKLSHFTSEKKKKKKKTGILFEHQGFSRVPKVLGISEISFNLYNLPNLIGQKKKSKLPNFF